MWRPIRAGPQGRPQRVTRAWSYSNKKRTEDFVLTPPPESCEVRGEVQRTRQTPAPVGQLSPGIWPYGRSTGTSWYGERFCGRKNSLVLETNVSSTPDRRVGLRNYRRTRAIVLPLGHGHMPSICEWPSNRRIMVPVACRSSSHG